MLKLPSVVLEFEPLARRLNGEQSICCNGIRVLCDLDGASLRSLISQR